MRRPAKRKPKGAQKRKDDATDTLFVSMGRQIIDLQERNTRLADICCHCVERNLTLRDALREREAELAQWRQAECDRLDANAWRQHRERILGLSQDDSIGDDELALEA
jgi:hypothetical protein